LNCDIDEPSNGCTGDLVTYLNNDLRTNHIPGTTTITELDVSNYNYCPSLPPYKYCPQRQTTLENSLNPGASVISLLSTNGELQGLGGWYWAVDNSGNPPYPELTFNLTNKNTGMPFLIAPACAQGAVNVPDYECTTRRLIVFANGGIIGAIAPTSGSEQHENGYVLNKFNDLIFQDSSKTYGEIFKTIKGEMATQYPLWHFIILV
jgi:Peptidase family C25